MFSFLKDKLSKIYSSFSSKLLSVFSKKVDEAAIKDLKRILLESDAGVNLTNKIIKEVESRYQNGQLSQGAELKDLLESILNEVVTLPTSSDKESLNSKIFLLVGVNGSGKTTFAAKLANFHKNLGKRVLLVAADTFRAAAVQQLQEWANKTGSDIVVGSDGQDPAAVVFNGCQQFKQGGYDVMIIDTAGRLQTKTNLMQELAKIKRVVAKNMPEIQVCTLLTVDSMLGQNSFDQAKIFNESTQLDGLILTKLDGTGKGGIVFNIMSELKLPVVFVSFGENLDAMAMFDPKDFVRRVLSE